MIAQTKHPEAAREPRALASRTLDTELPLFAATNTGAGVVPDRSRKVLRGASNGHGRVRAAEGEGGVKPAMERKEGDGIGEGKENRVR
jgi:hypothetical protein